MNTSLQRLGKYRLQERVDGRGIVEVWKAFSPQLRRYVAIKILHPDLNHDPRFITRFEREAKAVASLHHPNIVQIHDFQAMPSGTLAYLVMDYIDGFTLADYIDNTSSKREFPSAAEIVHLFASVCVAIDYAHSKGVIHGDIKPTNILLDMHMLEGMTGVGGFPRPAWHSQGMPLHAAGFPHPAPAWHPQGMPLHLSHNMKLDGAVGNPIVSDFGITRLLGIPVGMLSRLGLVTPFYLSPKQAMGYVGDVASDIYSLGVILYEICTGVPPFQGDNPSTILMQHITATPTFPEEVNPAISPALSKVILRCLDKNPKMRFSTASELATTLAEVLGVPMPEIQVFPHAHDVVERAGGELIRAALPLHRTGTRHSFPHTSPGSAIHRGPTHTINGSLRLAQADVTDSAGEFVRFPHPSPEGAIHRAPTKGRSNGSWERSPASSHWSSPLTPLSPDWPPPQTPPTSAIPIAPTPSLLRLALERLGERSQKGVLREVHLVILAMLILVLIVSSLGTLLVLAHQNTAPIVEHVGYVYFLNSGQLYMNNNQGTSDEVQIDLHGIAAPPPGKSYYAWLLGDEGATEVPWLLLGKVSEYHGHMHFLYTGDAAHTNLLTDMSRFVITEDDANTPPNNPLLDSGTWRYYGRISQTPPLKDPRTGKRHTGNDKSTPYSMLDHIRYLLVQDPELQALGLIGGLNTWLMRNVEEISQWALNAQAAWEAKNTAFLSQQLINILYYVDGECISGDFAGMPSDMPTMPGNSTIAHIAHFSLLHPCSQQQPESANQLQRIIRSTPSDYVDSISFHLAGLIQSPGATPHLRMLAIQLRTAVNDVKSWLEQVRQDALHLCDMSGSQLTQTSAFSMLSDLEAHARYAFAGETNPVTAQVQEGVTWIYDNMQRLASIDVTAYPTE